MIPKSSKVARISFVVALILAAIVSTEARRCGSGSCGTLAPRGYRFSRTPDPFSLVSDIFSMPLYSNSLMRQLNAETSRLAAMPSNSLNYDVTEDRETGVVELTLEVPGVTAKDLEIELENETQLRIRGSRKVKHHGSYYQSEFDQIFQLDKDVDSERLEASLSAGILTVRVPKRERIVKKIPIAAMDESEDVKLVKASQQDSSVVRDEKVSKVEEVEGLEVTEEE